MAARLRAWIRLDAVDEIDQILGESHRLFGLLHFSVPSPPIGGMWQSEPTPDNVRMT